MMLKSFGCSFIYGSDLSDDGKGFPLASPSKLSWPSLLAQSLNYTYECYARPGSGNLRILEKVLNIRDIIKIYLIIKELLLDSSKVIGIFCTN